MKEKLMHQNNTIFHFLLLIILTLGLHSCEFDSNDDNYIHIEKPKDEIQLGIDLAGVNPEDIIYVYNNSSFGYTLYTDNKEVLIRQFFLDGSPIETDQQTGIAILKTNTIDKEVHELKLVIGLKAGSESLAEYAGLEMYIGEFTFKIKFIPYSDNLNIRETTDSNVNLKLEWDKPENYEITGYDIYKGEHAFGELLASINNPNETYFVDLDYAYGYKHYTIVAKIKNSFNLTIQDNIAVRYWNLTEDNFKTYRISANELYIKWENPNPFPCKYVLTHGFYGEKIIIDNDINEIIIPANDFPSWTESFSLYILPKTADVNRYEYYSHVYASYSDKRFGGINFSGDIQNKQIHLLDFDSLSSFDISSMQKTGAAKHNLRLHTGCVAEVSADGKIAINDADGFIHIYSNFSLTNKITKMEAGNYPFHLTDNNRILIEDRSGFKICDVVNNNVVCSKKWLSLNTNGEIVTTTSISPDGKYAYVQCKEYVWASDTKYWTELLEINNNDVTLLEKTDGETNIQSISFNPLKSTEAIIQYSPYNGNKFVIVDILTKEKKEIKGEFMNIDPFTGDLLYKGETYSQDNVVYILDKTYTKKRMILKLANLAVSGPRLYNNNIFFSGSYLNLRNLKEWNQ